jgi:hypothetical protein
VLSSDALTETTGFVPAIHVFCETAKLKGVDAEHKVGGDEK